MFRFGGVVIPTPPKKNGELCHHTQAHLTLTCVSRKCALIHNDHTSKCSLYRHTQLDTLLLLQSPRWIRSIAEWTMNT